MDRSLIIDWGGVEYPNQKPPGYGECNLLMSVCMLYPNKFTTGRNLPLTNKSFELEEQQRRAWYNEEMQQ